MDEAHRVAALLLSVEALGAVKVTVVPVYGEEAKGRLVSSWTSDAEVHPFSRTVDLDKTQQD